MGLAVGYDGRRAVAGAVVTGRRQRRTKRRKKRCGRRGVGGPRLNYTKDDDSGGGRWQQRCEVKKK
jgi:hypothetical protein